LINKGFLNTNTAHNAVTNAKSENDKRKSRDVLLVSVSTGAKEYEKTNGRFWPVGFHQDTARFPLARVLKHVNSFFFNFQFFFSLAVLNCGYAIRTHFVQILQINSC
jgi:hypothetical protein